MDSNDDSSTPRLLLAIDDAIPFMAYGVVNPTNLQTNSSHLVNTRYPSFAAAPNENLPYLLSHGSADMERFSSLLPFSAMKFSDRSLMGDESSYSHQGSQTERNGAHKSRKVASSKDSTKAKSQHKQSRALTKAINGPNSPSQISKKPRFGAEEDRIEQRVFQGLLMNGLNYRNPQIEAMVNHHLQKTQIQRLISSHSSPQLRQIGGVVSHQQSYLPLFDGDLCYRRFMQYLYHLRNRGEDNGIGYWKSFVSEYYAPGAKKRWCFCKFQNVDLRGTGVFCPKNMEIWSCDVCGSKSGRGLEATFELLPLLYKKKFEAGLLEEMLSLDLPQSYKTSFGLVMEFKKATQVSVYSNSRIVHVGKLRLVFRHDLKMLSWEFCALNHEEFMRRTAIVPQITQLVHAAHGFRYNDAFSRGISQADLNRFALAKDQLKKSMEMPIVNDLGYPKQFVRCLQITEVVNSMKDLMDLSIRKSLGPIESLHEFVRSVKGDTPTPTKGRRANDRFLGPKIRQKTEENRGETHFTSAKRKRHANEPLSANNRPNQHAMNLARWPISPSPRTAPQVLTRQQQQTQLSDCDQSAHKALVEKVLREMTAANRAKNVQETLQRANSVALEQYEFLTSLPRGPMQASEARNDEMGFGGIPSDGSSSSAQPPKVSSDGFSRRNCGCPMTVARGLSIKAEPRSPQKSPEAYESSHEDLSGIGDYYW